MRHWATTYFGARILCDDVDVIQRMIATHGIWEPDVSHVIERRLRRGDVFIDIGANIGYDSLLAASCVGATGSVVAIEPSAPTYDLLCNNIGANGYPNVRPVWAAVSDQARTVELYEYGPTNTGATTTMARRRMFRDGNPDQAFHGSPAGTANALPLLDLLKAEELSKVRLIKIDVEGGEGPIVRNILDHIDEYPRGMEIVVEVDPELDDWDHLLGWLTQEGFAAYAIENSYAVERYHRWREQEPLALLESVPTEQVDLLLTRHM
jgi:FkbM family methyltransferase